MLMTEWKWEDALDFRYNEGIGIGREEGWEEGVVQTARNALQEGLPIAIIQKITGLEVDTIKAIQAEL